MMLTQAQIHGIVRFIMTVTGTVLASFGYTKIGLNSDQSSQLGTLLPLASFAWNMYSHSSTGLARHFVALKDDK
jgi:hypothetical protein